MADLTEPDPSHGVFATTLVVGGVPCELGAHLDRLGTSVQALYDRALPAGAEERARERAAGLALGRLRLSLIPAEGRSLSVEAAVQPVERAIVFPGWERALDLRSAVVRDWNGAHNWLDRRLLDELAARVAPDAALLLDPTRGVLETTRANVFAVGADGVLRTPPLDGTILPGIARARVIELAGAVGIEVREERLDPADLHAARELFATGSVRGVEPVRSLDGVAVGGPGPVTAALAHELRRRWLGETAPA